MLIEVTLKIFGEPAERFARMPFLPHKNMVIEINDEQFMVNQVKWIVVEDSPNEDKGYCECKVYKI